MYKTGQFVKAIRMSDDFSDSGVFGKVINISEEKRVITGVSTILHVLTASGMEYEVNASSKLIRIEPITERKYFHELIKFPTGIFP